MGVKSLKIGVIVSVSVLGTIYLVSELYPVYTKDLFTVILTKTNCWEGACSTTANPIGYLIILLLLILLLLGWYGIFVLAKKYFNLAIICISLVVLSLILPKVFFNCIRSFTIKTNDSKSKTIELIDNQLHQSFNCKLFSNTRTQVPLCVAAANEGLTIKATIGDDICSNFFLNKSSALILDLPYQGSNITCQYICEKIH